MKRFVGLAPLVLLVAGMALGPVWAQAPAAGDAAANASETLSPEELDKLVGRIALYPDELVAIVLPASTYPLQIVQGARFLEKKKKNPELKPRKDWDTSVLGLLNYPQVVKTMNDDLDWTWKLGEAVVAQQKDVMNSIQQVRARAYAAGNLVSNDKQVIVQEKQIIIIKSPNPEVIYVPQYNPAVVVVQQPIPATIVYSNPYPVYYSPAATFFTGMFVGAAISYGLGWHNNDININRTTNINRPGTRPGGGEAWRPGKGSGSRPGARPGTRPGSRPGARPGIGSGSRQGVRTGSRPSSRQGARPGIGSGSRQGVRTGSRPSSRQGARPGTGTGSRQGARTGSRPSSRQGASRGSSRSGAFGGYGRGSNQRQYSQRGSRSRSSSQRSSRSFGGRSSGASRSRSSGGRRGGGRRR